MEHSFHRLVLSGSCFVSEEGYRPHMQFECLKQQAGLTYMVVDVNLMLYAPDKQRLHVGSRSPSLGYCFYCKAAKHQCL